VTNNADMKSPEDWAKDMHENFDNGQSFVVIAKDNADANKLMRAAWEVLGGRNRELRVTSQRIVDTISSAEIKFISAENQYQLRGVMRRTKLVDPLGLANSETRHRFK
jgi:hypothetical protein